MGLPASALDQQEQLALAAKYFELSREGIVITDVQGTILAINPFFCEVTGYVREDVIGQTPRLLKSGMHDANFYRVMWNSISQTGHWSGEITNRRKDGSFYTEWLSITAVKDAAGKTTHYIGHFSDIADRRLMNERLLHLTQYDALTDLPNRTLLADRLDQTLSNAVRFERSVALFAIDLARFRSINETHGHGAGDKVLIEIAHRLAHLVRSGDTVARSGADDFTIILANLQHDKDAILLAQRVLERIAQPIDIGDRQISLTANTCFRRTG